MFVVANPTYPRDPVEKVFKTIYNLSTLIHVVSLVVIMTEFYLRLETSIPNYFTSSTFVMGANLRLVMRSCTYSASVRMGSVSGVSDVTLSNLPFGLMYVAQYTLGILVVQLLVIVNNAMNAMNYTTGNRHVRIFGLHMPYYHILITFSYVYCIALIVMVWTIENTRSYYTRAIDYCASLMEATDPMELLLAEFDRYHIFETPIVWAFCAAVVNIVLYSLGGFVLLIRSSPSGIVQLSQADWPWESHNALCTVVKQRLAMYTRERKAILEEVKAASARGERMRIIKTYQAIPEEEFLRRDREAYERTKKEVQDEAFAGMMEELRAETQRANGQPAPLPRFSWGRYASNEPPPPVETHQADGFMPNSFAIGEEFANPDYPMESDYEVGEEYAGSPNNNDDRGSNRSYYYQGDEDGVLDNGADGYRNDDGRALEGDGDYEFGDSDLDDDELSVDVEGEGGGRQDEDGHIHTPGKRRRRKHKRKRRHGSRTAPALAEPTAEIDNYRAYTAQKYTRADDMRAEGSGRVKGGAEEGRRPGVAPTSAARRQHHSHHQRDNHDAAEM